MSELSSRGFDPIKRNENNPQPGKSWFFGIGINEYQHFSNLNNAVKDVKDLIKLLQEKYELEPGLIVTLFNEDANRGNIIRKFDWLQEEVKPEDKLLIYFSGHGHLIDRGQNKKGYWVPADAEKDNTAKYISNSIIRDYIEDINSLHTLLISDACFSGSLFVRGSNRSETAFQELEQRKSRWAICSGRHNELVYDGEPGNNSPFANSILDILETNQKEKLNVAKLADRVVELTRASYKQLPEGNPLFGVGHKGGQYIFCLKLSEDNIWKSIKVTNSIEAYLGYIKQYPEGKYAKEALNMMESLEEDITWEKAIGRNQLSSYSHYLIQYPEGRYINEAHKWIKVIEGEANSAKLIAGKPLKQQKEAKVINKQDSKFGKFTDRRDGQVYKTVEINGKTWLAENLNYDIGKGSWPYFNDPINGEIYGRLYTWEAANKACPFGWHLPTNKEWNDLVNLTGFGYNLSRKSKKAYAQFIKGGESGFDAFFGGNRIIIKTFHGLGTMGLYWSATSTILASAYGYGFFSQTRRVNRFIGRRWLGLSVRYIRD